MQEILLDIRQRILNKEYHNEEHIRLSLVARIVKECGWDIWNPTEVYTEFKATKKEDNTRVDVALFTHDFESTAVFIECKALGAFSADLGPVERQLRDYNRDHTALFTIITDGQHWRFYFSFTSGEFKDKLFCKFDLLQDGQEEIAAYLNTFLHRDNLVNRTARQKAEAYLMLGKKDRAMQDVRPDAEKLVSQPPFPSLPQAIVQLLAKKNLTITPEEANAFLMGATPRMAIALPKPPVAAEPTSIVAKQMVAQKPANPVGAAISKRTPIKPSAGTGETAFYLVLKRAGVKATGEWDAEARRLRVLAGSTAMLTTAPSISALHKSLRKKLLSQNVLAEQDGLLLFTAAYTFDNLMQAAATICGYSVNGKQAWRDKNGRPAAEYVDAAAHLA